PLHLVAASAAVHARTGHSRMTSPVLLLLRSLLPLPNCSPSPLSVARPPQTVHPIERHVSAEQGLPIIAAEARDPVVVLSESLASRNQLTVHSSRRISNLRRQPQHPASIQ